MNKKHSSIEEMKNSLSQTGPTFSSERLRKEIQSLSTSNTQNTKHRILCNSKGGSRRIICDSLEHRHIINFMTVADKNSK